MKEKIFASDGPQGIGPYSPAIKVGNTVYVSGQIGVDPATGKLVEGCVKCQCKQSLKNVKAQLVAAGFDMVDVVKATVYLADMNDFAAVNEVYATFFSEPYPARACFQVAALPANAKVEIEVVAVKD